MIKRFLLAITFISIATASVVAYSYFAKQRPALAAGNIINAVSCSYADVSAAISSASVGDTVAVPAGSCAWSSRLPITKGIIFKGAGVGNTIITSNYSNINGNDNDPINYLISYQPDATSISNNNLFRITGFTFDFNNKCAGIMLINGTATAINKIRIDHNDIKNSTSSTMSTRAIEIKGTVYGVIDNNTFSNNEIQIDSYGNNETSWNNLTFNFGSADCMYYEDNTFSISDTAHAGGLGGRYCARYNTYNHINNAGMYPWFDIHGNMGAPGGNLSAMGTEIYGNLVTMAYNNGVGMFDQRGGKAAIFNNKVVNTGASCSAKAREEWIDTANPPAIGPGGQPQHVSDSYFWNNRYNTTLVTMSEQQDCSNFNTSPNPSSSCIVSNTIEENREFWNQNISFNGTTGIGCGTLASRPATCTTGVGYWATNQSCSSVDSTNVGAHPTAPISGTLYKCAATDAWASYFTPYTYPHPLTISDTLPPPPPLKGDFNSDSKVNDLDFTSFKNAFKSIFNSLFDLNSDGVIDVKDLGVLMSSWLP